MRVGLLGPSGAGKTTLLSLAMRLYDLPVGTDAAGRSWGSVRLDGMDIRDLKLADLRRAVALVPQQAMLFDGTIRSNLLYAQPQATLAKVRRALEIADLYAMVDGLPDGTGYSRQRARTVSLRRAASASGSGTGDPCRTGCYVARRLHQRPGRRDRGPNSAGPRSALARPNLRDCLAQSLLGPPLRLDRRPGSRANRRAGLPPRPCWLARALCRHVLAADSCIGPRLRETTVSHLPDAQSQGMARPRRLRSRVTEEECATLAGLGHPAACPPWNRFVPSVFAFAWRELRKSLIGNKHLRPDTPEPPNKNF